MIALTFQVLYVMKGIRLISYVYVNATTGQFWVIELNSLNEDRADIATNALVLLKIIAVELSLSSSFLFLREL